MRLDPKTTSTEIAARLRAQAGQIYGEERAVELSEQIEHLSKMLAEIGSRELDLTGEPPDLNGIQYRDER